MQKIIPKKHLGDFVNSLVRRFDVVAPVKEGNTKFKKIRDSEQVWFDFVTDVPAKTHFLRNSEELIVTSKRGSSEEAQGKIKKTVLFGLRKCDLNAIQIMDKVMFDQQYLNKRKNTILVGMFCEKTDKYCFCNSMELEDYYDLFFYPKGEFYYIDIKSKKGEDLVRKLPNAPKDIKIPDPRNLKKLKTKDIEKFYRDSIWNFDVKKCLSCSACTMNCPTCNCFDIKDSVDLKTGRMKRARTETSCMLKSFSRVAGGKVYRDSRLARFKHFVFHKIVYYKKQKGRYMCVGCGRCLRVCPTKIDWVDTINNGVRKK